MSKSSCRIIRLCRWESQTSRNQRVALQERAKESSNWESNLVDSQKRSKPRWPATAQWPSHQRALDLKILRTLTFNKSSSRWLPKQTRRTWFGVKHQEANTGTKVPETLARPTHTQGTNLSTTWALVCHTTCPHSSPIMVSQKDTSKTLWKTRVFQTKPL